MVNSGILRWNLENIQQVPAEMGVFVLRTSPINGFIKKVDQVANLKDVLENIYREQTYQGVEFFEWYKADNIDESNQKLQELKSQLNI